MSYQYIYVMKELNKTLQSGRELMKNISLSFLPGAKIGVLGANGAGKSTLLKIMAGIETEYNGEAWAADGSRIGYLPQEPDLDPTKTVAGNAMEGVGEIKALVDKNTDIEFALGKLTISIDEKNSIHMKGPVSNIKNIEIKL